MIESKLFTLLSTTSSITAIIGSSTNCRAYPGFAPQSSTAPYVVYFKVSGERHYTHQGYNTLQSPRYQISCFAVKYSDAKDLADKIITALESWNATNIQAVFITDERMIYEEDTKIFHVPITFKVWAGE